MKSQHPRLASAVLGLAIGLSATLAPAAVLILNDGKRIEGDIANKGGAYDVKTRFGTLTVQKSDVRQIVQDAAQAAADAESCRKVARGMYDEALKCDTATDRNRKLTAGLELLQKALGIYNDAREIFTGPEYASLDKAAVDVVQEMRLYRDKMTTEQVVAPAAPPATPAPETPAPAPEARSDAPVSSGILAPPTPTTAEKLLAEAKRAAVAKRYSDARYIIARIAQQYPGSSVAGEAQALLDALPHPDGRLVCGFDSASDLRAWRVVNPYRQNLTFELISDAKRVRDGKGAAHLFLSRDPDYATGAIVLETGRIDETRFKGISFWLYQSQPSPGRLEVAFVRPNQSNLPWIDRWGASEMGACLYRAISLDFVGWKQVRIALPEFQPRGASGVSGKIGWKDAGALVFYDASRKGLDVVIDSVRFLEADRS
jgi:hypothetical protein